MSSTSHKIPIGISSCLTGERVRYDGGHRYAQFIVERLSDVFDLLPVCPEVGIGLGVPRDPIQLVITHQGIRVHGVEDSSIDVTEALHQFAVSSLQTTPGIFGYIFKARSPSCGINNVNQFDQAGQLLDSTGTGAYAQTIIKIMPGLPVADEEQFEDVGFFSEFTEKVSRYYKSREKL